MSEIMMGVLSMPDDMFWDDEPLTRYQHNQVRLQAARRIRELENANAELIKAAKDFLHEVANIKVGYGTWTGTRLCDTSGFENLEKAITKAKEPPRC